jgi:hypothetical protein
VRPRAAVPVTTASRSFSEGKMAAVVQSIAYHGARKVRQLALCWRVIAFIAHRIGDRTDPDVPAEVRRAVDTESAGPLVTRAILRPRQHCLPLHALPCPRCRCARRY